MADKGWTSRVATAAGAAAGTGAAQLGLGYGLGVVVWPVAATTDDSDWLGSLGWATWITASATVFGAVLASRLGGGPATRWSGARRLALATSAAVGALVAVALIALPARSAVRDDAFSPQVTAGGYALLGVLLGVIVAYWAVVSRPVAANLMATGVLLWALAITAIVVELAWQRDSATYLTSWQFAQVSDGERFGTIFWPSALLTLAAAFLIGATAVMPAIRSGNFGLGAAVSGVVGPLLVAVAFLALAPRLTGALGPLESAYLIAPYAVLAGLAGSSLAVTAGRAAADRRSRRTAADAYSDAKGVTSQLHPADLTADTSDGSGHNGASITDASPASVGPRPDGASPPDAAASRNAVATEPGPQGVMLDKTASEMDPPVAPRSSSPIPSPAPPPTSSPGKPSKAGGSTRSRPGRATAGEPPAGADPEIAAAARPTRERARNATTSGPRSVKSTVTPPPSDPTIAQINPNPTSDI